MTTDLNKIILSRGSHRTKEDGMCLMEAVAHVAGEPHTAFPQCVCTVLIGFGHSLNDHLPDDLRQGLIPLIPRLIGTEGDGAKLKRVEKMCDTYARVIIPFHLRAFNDPEKFGEHIKNLEAAPQPLFRAV